MFSQMSQVGKDQSTYGQLFWSKGWIRGTNEVYTMLESLADLRESTKIGGEILECKIFGQARLLASS